MRAQFNDGILSLDLDSPKTKNAFGIPEAKILLQSLKHGIRLIVLSAQGKVFCSGGNLQEYAKLKTKASGLKVNSDIRAALNKLHKYPAPKIALVTGDCFGGGIELLSCFDWVLSEPHVFFGMWQRRQELSFGWGGYDRLKKRVSESDLHNWLLAGELKSSLAAYRIGLVSEVVAAGQMTVKFESLKSQLLEFEQTSYREIKNGLVEDEKILFEKLWWSKTHQKKLKK